MKTLSGRRRVTLTALICLGLALLACLPLRAEELPCPVKVEVRESPGRNLLVLTNSIEVPVTIALTFKLSNVDPPTIARKVYVLPAKGTVDGPLLKQADKSKAWHWDYTSRYRIGDYRVKKTSHIYALPWPEGRGFGVNQGFHGDISHQGLEAYAVDFDLPEGTPVIAARGGLVVSARSDSDKGGPDPSFRDTANYVILAHKDGTVTRYYHLQKGSVAVRLGEWVKEGRLLGRSGNTGYSTAPHLHFDVCSPNARFDYQTMPFRVLVNGQAQVPGQGTVYTH